METEAGVMSMATGAQPFDQVIGDPATGATAALTGSPQQDVGNRRVYVGNLSWSTTWQVLKDYMKQAGDVIRADILQDGQGRSKGCAVVEFKSSAQARNAIATLNNTELDGRQIFLREDREVNPVGGVAVESGGHHHSSPSRADPSRHGQRVYVGNLSWNVDKEQLKHHMSEVGEVLYAEVLVEPSGRSKGCGIVEYANATQAGIAIERMHNTTLNGRAIFVREDRETGGPSGSIMHHHANGGGAHLGMMGSGMMGGLGHHPGHGPPLAHAHHHMMMGAPRAFGNMGSPRGPMGTRVYVGNLPYECSWQELKDHMRRVGNVVHADVLEDGDKRSKGCGIVEYDNPHAALRAIRELNNTELKGRLVFVREDREDKKMQGMDMGGMGYMPMGGGMHMQMGRQSAVGRQLFVSNLDVNVTWQDLKDHFKTFEVVRADVPVDNEGRCRGYGTVRFTTAAEAQRALQTMNHSQLHSRVIELREDTRAS